MSIQLRGYRLNQRQMDALTPVLNNQIQQGGLRKADFERACVSALEAAGCPLGYNAAMPGPETSIETRAAAWAKNGQVGMSSRAIYSHMSGALDRNGFRHPLDPDDLNRCLLLLDLIPEWRERMPEMAMHSREWAALVSDWEGLRQTFLDEVGLDWSKGKDRRATITSDIMRRMLSPKTGPQGLDPGI